MHGRRTKTEQTCDRRETMAASFSCMAGFCSSVCIFVVLDTITFPTPCIARTSLIHHSPYIYWHGDTVRACLREIGGEAPRGILNDSTLLPWQVHTLRVARSCCLTATDLRSVESPLKLGEQLAL